MALIVGSLATAGVFSRTTPPHATGDIGNRTEFLGLASLLVEGAIVAVASAAYAVVVPLRRVGNGARRTARVMVDGA